MKKTHRQYRIIQLLVNQNIGLEKKHQNYQKRRKKAKQQKEPHFSANINLPSGKCQVSIFTSFSLSIIADLFPAKIAGYTFI